MAKLSKLFFNTLAVGIAEGVAQGVTRLGTIWAARKLDLDDSQIYVTETEAEEAEVVEDDPDAEPEEGVKGGRR